MIVFLGMNALTCKKVGLLGKIVKANGGDM